MKPWRGVCPGQWRREGKTGGGQAQQIAPCPFLKSLGTYEGEDFLRNLLLILALYFYQFQFWIFIVVKGIYLDFVKREKRTWTKTEGF